MTPDPSRFNAFLRLLAKPDPPELKRGSSMRLEGSQERYKLVPILAAAFLQQRLLEESAVTGNVGDDPGPATSRWGRTRSIRFESA
jgi:hypothetical protein